VARGWHGVTGPPTLWHRDLHMGESGPGLKGYGLGISLKAIDVVIDIMGV